MTRYTLDVEGLTWTITAHDLDELTERVADMFVPGVRVELLEAERI